MNVAVASLQATAEDGQVTGVCGQSESLRGLVDLLEEEHRVTVGASAPSPPWKRILNYRRLGSQLEAADPDVVHLMLPTPNFTWIGELLAKRIDPPVVVQYNSSVIESTEFLYPSVRPSHLPWLAEKLLVNHSLLTRSMAAIARPRRIRHCIVSSRFQKRQLRALGFDVPISVVPNHSRLEASTDGRTDANGSFEDADDRVTLGYLGHVSPAKGLCDLLDAVGRLDADAALAVAWSGGGPDPRSLVPAHVTNVTQYGIVDKGAFFDQLDAIVLPYRFAFGTQIFPNTLLEAIHFETPIITSRLPYIDELLTDGRESLLFTPGDRTELAAVLERFVSQPGLRHRLSSAEFGLPADEDAVRRTLSKIYRTVGATTETAVQYSS